MTPLPARIRTSFREGVSAAPLVVALWGLAVAQPIYDLLTRNPEFLVVRGLSLGETVLIAGVLSFLAPLLLVGICLAVGCVGRTPQLALQSSVVALLASAVVLNSAQGLALPAPALVGGAFLAGALVVGSLRRWAVLRSWARLLALGAIVFPVVLFWRLPPSTWDDSTWGDGGAHTGREAPPPEAAVPIVFVLFDELSLVSLLAPNGKIDVESFPSFAALSRQANWYPFATTVATGSTSAIPALLSGRYPLPDQQPNLSDHPENLFTLLAPHYSINARESVTRLCPPTVCGEDDGPRTHRLSELGLDLGLAYLHVVLPATWSARMPAMDQSWRNLDALEESPPAVQGPLRRWLRQFRTGQTVDRATGFRFFLDRIDRPGLPKLHFYSVLLPHLGFAYLPSGRLYASDGRPAGRDPRLRRWGGDEWAVVFDYQRYLLQVGSVDRLLGLLVRRLREVDLYDAALLIVTADHGVSFRPRSSRRGVSPRQFAATLGVPLFVKLPHQRRGHRDNRPVELVDVLPTILDLIELDPRLERPLQGRSLLARPWYGRLHRVFFEPRRSGTIDVKRFPHRRLRRAIQQAVRRKVELFGTEGFSTRFYQIGAFGHLVGRRVSEIGVQPASSVQTEILSPLEHVDFAPIHGFVPAHIVGTSSPAGPGQQHHFAIAVNGTIRAVTRTWEESLMHRPGEWAAIVDERAFVPGANRIEVFHLYTAPAGVRMARTESFTVSPVPPGRDSRLTLPARLR